MAHRRYVGFVSEPYDLYLYKIMVSDFGISLKFSLTR